MTGERVAAPVKRARPGEVFLQHFIAPDGARIIYDDEGTGRPLVFLHGLMANRAFFDAQRDLAAQFRVIRVDLRGHGDSPSQHGLTVSQLAADIAALADQLVLDDAIVIGWSLGAAVLWELLDGPAKARFAGAVIVDMTPRVLNDSSWILGLTRAVCDARSAAIRDDFEGFARNAGAAIFAPPFAAERRAQIAWAADQFAGNDGAAIAALWESLVEQDFRPVLPRIDQPSLIIHGAHSHLYGAETAERIAALMPHARLLAFDRSGHAPHIEQPDLFNQAIEGFAARLPHARETQSSI